MGLVQLRSPGGGAPPPMKRGRGSVPWLAALLLGLAASPARAHDQPYSYVDLELEHGRLEVALAVHRIDAASALGVAEPESLTAPGFLRGRDARLAKILGPRLRLEADGRPLELHWRGGAIDRERRAISLRFDAPLPRRPGRLGVRARLFPDDPQHETFVNAYDGSTLLREEVLTAERPEIEIFTTGPAGILAVLLTFVPAGVHHILIGPDHVLFLLGLLLLGGSFGRVLKIATSFTIAHSVTLALAALGLFQPTPRLIEPAIALSVAVVGLENLRRRSLRSDHRAQLAFAFGFIHGFGFAGVLRELGLPREALGWSLFSFNLGVELGQAVLIAAALPLLGWLRAASPRWAPRVVAAGSWGVILAGGWWFVERLLLRA